MRCHDQSSDVYSAVLVAVVIYVNDFPVDNTSILPIYALYTDQPRFLITQQVGFVSLAKKVKAGCPK